MKLVKVKKNKIKYIFPIIGILVLSLITIGFGREGHQIGEYEKFHKATYYKGAICYRSEFNNDDRKVVFFEVSLTGFHLNFENTILENKFGSNHISYSEKEEKIYAFNVNTTHYYNLYNYFKMKEELESITKQIKGNSYFVEYDYMGYKKLSLEVNYNLFRVNRIKTTEDSELSISPEGYPISKYIIGGYKEVYIDIYDYGKSKDIKILDSYKNDNNVTYYDFYLEREKVLNDYFN